MWCTSSSYLMDLQPDNIRVWTKRKAMAEGGERAGQPPPHSDNCLCSLAMVLNTLQIDPRRAWKGPWRWFHEQMLDCCLPIARVAEEGIVLDQASKRTALP